MVYCHHCQDNVGTVQDSKNGSICCMVCGRVIGLACLTSEPEFIKDKHGQVNGQLVRSTGTSFSVSHEGLVQRARDEMWDLVNHLGIGGGDGIVNQAIHFYEIALDKNFTEGRKASHVAAVCVYMTCRTTKMPYLLIDFSDHLMISVYVLGAIFLQLRELLKLSEHPLVQTIIDPSLYIHRFTDRLLGRSDEGVTRTALQIVASVKRDWMQKGRKPGGLCSAAIYVSVLSHGLNYSESDIVTVVQNCETTLTKRLNKFEKTESGSVTIEEFLSKADAVDQDSEQSYHPEPCKHKNGGRVLHCAHRLCRICFDEFIKISGGLKGRSESPAIQHTEKQRTIKSKKARNDETEAKIPNVVSDSTRRKQIKFGTDKQRFEKTDCGGQDSLPDIDDSEVDRYINSMEEQQMKAIIWEEMNKEYLEEQKLKASAHKSREPKKKRKQRSAGEATEQMPKKKTFSSKVNYEALECSYTMDKENDSENGNAESKEDPVQEHALEVDEDDAYNDEKLEEAHYDPNYDNDYEGNEYEGNDEKFEEARYDPNYDNDYEGNEYEGNDKKFEEARYDFTDFN